MNPQLRAGFVACLAALFAGLGAASASVPTVVALDTSRSLSSTQLADAAARLAGALGALPATESAGAITFDDSPRWLAPVGSSPERAAGALRGAAPAGRFTVLRDALFVAASALPDGGVILLATDGRDENSAATAEDVARVCAANRVRIVAWGVGKSIDERALRRLALLTGGAYVRSAADPSGEAFTRAAAEARLAATPAARPEPTPAPAAAAVPPPAAPREATSSSQLAPLALAAILGALLVAAAAAVVVVVRRRSATRTCPRCGSLLASWETECSACLLRDADERQSTAVAAPADDAAALPPEVFRKAPLEDQLDKTFALQDQETLTVRERKRPPRSYVLHADEVFSVGRAPAVNTLVLDDPTLSAQHFKLVPRDGEFFVVDLDTTNGTIVNGEKARARKLHPGDTIRAGEIEFEYRVAYRRVS